MKSPRANLFLAIGSTVALFYLGAHPLTAGLFSSFGYTAAHFASFGILAFFFARALPRAHLVLIGLFVAAIGGLLEVYQELTSSGHYAELGDVLADSAGALSGAVLSRFAAMLL
jgi:VanZ family protein